MVICHLLNKLDLASPSPVAERQNVFLTFCSSRDTSRCSLNMKSLSDAYSFDKELLVKALLSIIRAELDTTFVSAKIAKIEKESVDLLSEPSWIEMFDEQFFKETYCTISILYFFTLSL